MWSHVDLDIQLPEDEVINFPITSTEDLKNLSKKAGTRIKHFSEKAGNGIETFFDALETLGIKATADGIIGGGSPGSALLTFGRGFPGLQPTLIPITLVIALIGGSLGSLLSLAKKEKKYEKAHADYLAVMSGLSALMFMLKLEIAIIVFAKDLKNSHQQVTVSNGEFAAIVLSSALFPVINSAVRIATTHKGPEGVTNKYVQGLNTVAMLLIGSSLTHTTLSTTASLTGAFKIDGDQNDANAVNQFWGYLACLAGGIAITAGLKLTKKNVAAFINYLNAANISYFLYQSFQQAITDKNSKDTEKSDRALLIFMWAVMIAIPILVNAGKTFYQRCKVSPANDGYQQVAQEENQLSVSEISGSDQNKMEKNGITEENNGDDYDSDEELVLEKTTCREIVVKKVHDMFGMFKNKSATQDDDHSVVESHVNVM